MSKAEYLVGRAVKIIATSNPFAVSKIGQTGIVSGPAPMLGMVVVVMDGDSAEYWAQTYNLAELH